MKPHVILHMASSIDDRVVPEHWPKGVAASLSDIYERVHQDLKGEAWIVGRVTMADFQKGDPNRATATEAFPRSTWKAPGVERGPYAIALDRGAKLNLNQPTIEASPGAHLRIFPATWTPTNLPTTDATNSIATAIDTIAPPRSNWSSNQYSERRLA